MFPVHVPSIQASQLHSTLLKGIDLWMWRWQVVGALAKVAEFLFGDGQIKEVIVKKNTTQNFGMPHN